MEINVLWEKYSKNKDQAVREELILHYVYLVKYIAGLGIVGALAVAPSAELGGACEG